MRCLQHIGSKCERIRWGKRSVRRRAHAHGALAVAITAPAVWQGIESLARTCNVAQVRPRRFAACEEHLQIIDALNRVIPYDPGTR